MTAGVFLSNDRIWTCCVEKRTEKEALLISMHVTLTVQLDSPKNVETFNKMLWAS